MYSVERKEKVFKTFVLLSVLVAPAIIIGMVITLLDGSILVLSEEKLNFFTTTNWDPINKRFGVLVFLVGTFLTSLTALFLSLPFSLAIALVTAELYKKNKIANFISFMVEIISAVPSVVVGLWGIFFMAPVMRELQLFFGYTPYGTGFLTTSIILAFMIIPFASALGREVILLVPEDIKEAAYSLGATRFEVIKKVILPYVSTGFLGGVFLSMGRAIGETMAVTMLIGNVNYFPENIFSPTNTMASIIANEFAEATEEIYISALMGVGLVLLISTLITSVLGKWVIKRLTY